MLHDRTVIFIELITGSDFSNKHEVNVGVYRVNVGKFRVDVGERIDDLRSVSWLHS